MSSLSRPQWQDLARTRIGEAEALLAAGAASSAYYLAGFSVECAVKACIAKVFQAECWPSREFVRDIYQHDLWELARHAGLRPVIQKRMSVDLDFGRNWTTLRRWSNEDRYRVFNVVEASALVAAANGKDAGVLPWIEMYW